MFWFENDLKFVNKKKTPKQHHGCWKIEKKKKIGMLTRNNKMTTRNNKGVENHIGNTKGVKLNMKIFFF
jgi:hypothetical protein